MLLRSRSTTDPAVGVLDQEFVAPVLQGEDPAAGFNHESGCAAVLVHGSTRLGNGKPECFMDRLVFVGLGAAVRVDGGSDWLLLAHLRVHCGGHAGAGCCGDLRGTGFLSRGRVAGLRVRGLRGRGLRFRDSRPGSALPGRVAGAGPPAVEVAAGGTAPAAWVCAVADGAARYDTSDLGCRGTGLRRRSSQTARRAFCAALLRRGRLRGGRLSARGQPLRPAGNSAGAAGF